MQTHVKVLAVLYLVMSGIGLLFALLIFFALGTAASIVGMSASPDDAAIALPILGITGTALSVFLLSLAGFPMTAGFMAKLLVFKSAWQKGLSMLVVFGVLNSAASVYYYLRPIVLMYFAPSGEGERRAPAMAATTVAALSLSLLAVFYLGLLPDAVLKFFAFGAR